MILGATVFYLSVDPVDKENIPLYRRNLVYLAESRWHLAILTDKTWVKDEDFFKTTRVNHHDYVMEAYQDLLQEGPPQRNQDNEATPFSEAEMEVILAEGLDWFFKEDLKDYVSKVHLSPYFTITDHHNFTRMSSSVWSRPGGSQESQEESPHWQCSVYPLTTPAPNTPLNPSPIPLLRSLTRILLQGGTSRLPDSQLSVLLPGGKLGMSPLHPRRFHTHYRTFHSSSPSFPF